MTDSPALVLAAHGTRHPDGPRTLAALAGLVAGRLPGTPVAVAFVDVVGPTLADVLADRLARSARAVVVPVFLGTGYHVEVDLPRGAAAHGGRVTVAPALGPAPEVVRAVADRLAEASRGRGAGGRPDAVVLAAAGSSRERSRQETVRAAAALERLLGTPVTVGFASAAGPSVAEAVVDARRASRHAGRPRSDTAGTGPGARGGAATVAVASYLLAPGAFQARLAAAGADLVADPIGAHPALADLVVRRHRAAVSAAISAPAAESTPTTPTTPVPTVPRGPR